MRGQLVRLIGPEQRALAKRMLLAAPDGTEVTFAEPKRSLDQNALMHVLLSDVARARPEGRVWPPDTWKGAFMSAMGYEVHWQPGLEGSPPFPAGFRSSRLSKAAMSDLIEWIYAYGARHGVAWSEPRERKAS